MNIKVKNKKTYKGEGEYIGRPSPLGNPFKINSEEDREESLSKYRVWLDEKLKDRDSKQSKELLRLLNILQTTGKLVLICWCKPKPCHGDILKEKLTYEWYFSQ